VFIILYYDVGEARCSKMLKQCRAYLQWVQNSVFEGEISLASYEELIYKLKEIMDEDSGDSIVVYKFRTLRYTERIVFGQDKKGDFKFI